ncbi:GH32 C-terminal domain-containing protein [Paenibacillus sp.]|uniref:GH32 C-terminal domain-containing protein n=1 Tax=Paenibacillus sp. TaxID=58172 RepID=UPI002D30553E|nr:GH32 C-terminal domain-containing protein [Paenibacillus sp.]HZG85811.1 GH32 C-terminal domain-containing protein [Paenibacillus sp.]
MVNKGKVRWGKRWIAALLRVWLALATVSAGLTPFGASASPGHDWLTNLPGYLPVSGQWTTQPGLGLSGTGPADANVFAISTVRVGSKFTFEADVRVDAGTPYGVGSLVFRSTSDGANGYVVSVDPNLDRVRLFDYDTGADVAPPQPMPLEPGTWYRVRIDADGANLRVAVDGAPVFSAQDTAYGYGHLGFHVYNGTAHFQNVYAYETRTNLAGWSELGGDWEQTSLGWKATAASGQNGKAMSGVWADDFTYEADLLIEDAYAVGTLLFRSDAAGTHGYALQVDPNMDRLRLYRTADDVTLGVKSMALDAGKVYRVRIKAEGPSIKAYVQTDFRRADGYDPAISVSDSSYAGGFAGLNAYNGTVRFDNVVVSDLRSNLGGWQSFGGTWTPHLHGRKAVSEGASDAFRFAAGQAGDVVLEGDLRVDPSTPFGTAALVFRVDEAGASGYAINIDPNLDRIRLFDLNGGATIASAAMQVEAGRWYRLEIHAKGSRIEAFVDGGSAPALAATDGRYVSGRVGLSAFNGTAYFQNVHLFPAETYYGETYRPQYHYTMALNWISDPCGLVYYDGEYHLFAQDGGTWTHAVSTDLVHWRRLPTALPWNEAGHAWTGSAVADEHDVSGLFQGGSGLIAYYTMFHPDKPGGNQKIGIAYSKDRGRTWQFYEGNPIVENPGGPDGGWDFRDPKVVRDEERGRWVMVVSGGDHVRFYTSTNLVDWTYASSFGYGNYLHGGVWECPDFFPLPVDGDPLHTKWVLAISNGAVPQNDGSSSEYFVGSFDGTTFVSDNPAGTVLRGEHGKDMYAAMTFADAPGGRRIQLGWMANWDYPFSFPTAPWKGQMSIPRELSLRTIPGQGVRLVQTPAAELRTLRGTPQSWRNIALDPQDANLLENVSGTAYEIVAEFELPSSGAATEFGFRLRERGEQRTVVGYDAAASRLFVDRSEAGRDDFAAKFTPRREAELLPDERRIRMSIFVDESSVEAFGKDGEVAFSTMMFPDAASDGLSLYTIGGRVDVVALDIYPLSDIWTGPPPSGDVPRRVVMDQALLELAEGESRRLYARVLPETAADRSVVWQSSNPEIATVSDGGDGGALVTAAKRGEARVTATTSAGAVVGTTVVRVGAFHTNAAGWTAGASAARWAAAADGISAMHDADAAYMSSAQASDFTFEADLKIDEAGGSGSLVFRASPDGSSGYYLSVTPGQRAVRLLAKVDGSFMSGPALAEAPLLLQQGTTYRVKVVASGTNIKAYLGEDAQPVIDTNDSRFAGGNFGVHVSGGRAYFQNVNFNN